MIEQPYSYGLQACDAAASIVVASWNAENGANDKPSTNIEAVTQVYEDLAEATSSKM